MTPQDISYALAKQVPDMRRGFTIQTSYGDIQIEAEQAAPIIAAVQKVLLQAQRKTK